MKKVKVISLVTLSALSSLFVTAVLAVEDAGRVMFVAGQAMIVNAAGQESIARKGDFLKQGDRLVTSDNGMIQVKMRDDGAMAVRPNTDLKLNDMVPQLNQADGPSQALLLSRGGVRVLTGNERNRMGYLIKTAATSISLHNGDTEALVIPVPPTAAGRVVDPSPAGTYNRMNTGVGIIQGAAGKDLSLAANQTSYTPSVSVAPELVASLPPSYINTTVSVPTASGAKPSIATIAPSTASVPGGMALAPALPAPENVGGGVLITSKPTSGTGGSPPIMLAPIMLVIAPSASTLTSGTGGSPPLPVITPPPTIIPQIFVNPPAIPKITTLNPSSCPSSQIGACTASQIATVTQTQALATNPVLAQTLATTLAQTLAPAPAAALATALAAAPVAARATILATALAAAPVAARATILAANPVLATAPATIVTLTAPTGALLKGNLTFCRPGVPPC